MDINNNCKKTIGILGGMGPVASMNLYKKIIYIAQKKYKAKLNYQFPPMVIYNLSLIGLNETGLVKPELVKNQLINGAKVLEKAGSDFIIIACNTVHYFYPNIQKVINIPVLNMIEETLKKVQSGNYKIAGLLATESTNNLQLYQKMFEKNDIRILSVNFKQQKIINKVIYNVMSGKQGESDKIFLKKIINALIRQGAECIVLGCTELPLAIFQDDSMVKLFNSTEIIATAAPQYSYGN